GYRVYPFRLSVTIPYFSSNALYSGVLRRFNDSFFTISCSFRTPSKIASGRGGQPGTYTSTGIISSIPCKTEYVSKIPPLDAQPPTAITQRASAICIYTCSNTGAIFLAIGPITRSISACLGEKLGRSAPNRARSYVDPMVAINSIPQHEVANGNGHNEFARARPIALSNVVAKNPAPSTPGGASANVTLLMTIVFLVYT